MVDMDDVPLEIQTLIARYLDGQESFDVAAGTLAALLRRHLFTSVAKLSDQQSDRRHPGPVHLRPLKVPPPAQWTGNPPPHLHAISGSKVTTFSTTVASFSL